MLTRCLFLLSGEGLLGTLKLVALGLRDEKVLPPPEGASPAEVAEPLPMPIGTLLDSIALEAFVTRFMLQGSSAAIRHEAGATLHHLWSHASPAERERLFAALRAPLGALPVYGANGRELMALLGTMMSASEMSVPQTTQLLDDLILHLKQQDKLLAGHPNAHVYHALGAILELEGHYLEAEPLHATVQPELPSQSLKLEALKAETKFTDSCQIVKFAGSNTIHSGVLRITDSRRTQMVSTIHLYCNNKPVADVGELKNKSELWKRVKTLAVQPAQAEIRFDFTIPVVATNLLIEYAAFHESSAAAEKLQCPRCSRSVTDKHGICKHCGDNAYQCRHCRNINYEKLDAFLCNECGFCKHARFDFTLVVKPSYVVERISNEAEREKLLALIDTELQNANKRHSQLATLKRPLERLLGHPADAVLQLFGAAGAGAHAAGCSGIGMPSIGLGGGLGAPGAMWRSCPLACAAAPA
jgi:E3 ubiquitin-protein ligase UBR4